MNSVYPHIILDDMQKSSGDDGKLFKNHLQLEEETTHASAAPHKTPQPGH